MCSRTENQPMNPPKASECVPGKWHKSAVHSRPIPWNASGYQYRQLTWKRAQQLITLQMYRVQNQTVIALSKLLEEQISAGQNHFHLHSGGSQETNVKNKMTHHWGIPKRQTQRKETPRWTEWNVIPVSNHAATRGAGRKQTTRHLQRKRLKITAVPNILRHQ